MDNDLFWGVLLIAYIVPYWIWAVSRDHTIETRKRLFPGRPEYDHMDRRSTLFGLIWSIGIGLLLLGWWIGMNPLVAAMILMALAGLIVGIIWISRQAAIVTSLYFRYWLASSAIWLMLVLAWYFIFWDEIDFEDHQVVLLVILPPIVAGFAILAFRWAKLVEK
jgi:hypothetical protein